MSKKKYHAREFNSFKALAKYMNEFGSAPVIEHVAPSTKVKAIFEGEDPKLVDAPENVNTGGIAQVVEKVKKKVSKKPAKKKAAKKKDK